MPIVIHNNDPLGHLSWYGDAINGQLYVKAWDTLKGAVLYDLLEKHMEGAMIEYS